jgi:hypothetical protein
MAVGIFMDGMLVEHLGVAPAVQEPLNLKVKLVNKGSQPLEGGESHSLRHEIPKGMQHEL